MGCFLACFGSSKDKKRRHRQSVRVPSGAECQKKGYSPAEKFVYPDETLAQVEKVGLPDDDVKPVNQAGSPMEERLDSPTSLVSKLQNSGADEFGTEIHGSTQPEASPEKSNLAYLRASGFRNGEMYADELISRAKKEVNFDSVVKTHAPVGTSEVLGKEVLRRDEFSEKEEAESLAKPSMFTLVSEAGSNISSLGSYPSNHRYQNCRESDEEEAEGDCTESEVDVDYNDSDLEEDEHSDSLCSLESATKISSVDGISPEVIAHKKNTEATNDYDRSVLNPVENLSQWKALTTTGPRLEKSALELHGPPIISFSSEPEFSQTVSVKSKVASREKLLQPMAVDASLSNWLTSPEPINKSMPQRTVLQGSYSPKSLEDRPILGALTVEELRLMSRITSPKRSPTKSPDDMAIIGSVGSYWSHEESDKDSGSVSSYKGIPNTTSKYREDKRVNWHSTPFETRLEKALNRTSAQP